MVAPGLPEGGGSLATRLAWPRLPRLRAPSPWLRPACPRAAVAWSSQSFLHSDELTWMSASNSGRVGIVGWLAWSAAVSIEHHNQRRARAVPTGAVIAVIDGFEEHRRLRPRLENSRISQLPAASSYYGDSQL